MRDWAAELVERARTDGVALTGEDGLLTALVQQVLQTGLEVEMTDHLGYEPHAAARRNSGNNRNGSYPKTVTTEIGKVALEVPRDRNPTFDPRTVRKGQRRLDGLSGNGTSNPVILTGDVHAHYLCDVKANFEDPASATIATEVVGTSIATGGDGVENNAGDAVQFAENPHIKFINRRRGYVRNVVTPETWTVDYRVVDFVRTPGAPISTRASFVIENGHPGGVPA